MKCDEAQALFAAYVDGELSDPKTRSLDEHLAACRKCADELRLICESQAALSCVLDCDAVPRTSLEEFVSAVTSAESEDGITGRIAAFIATPRRALAATIGGSLALTSALLFLAWVSVMIPSTEHRQQTMQSPLQQYRLMIGNADIKEEGELHNGS